MPEAVAGQLRGIIYRLMLPGILGPKDESKCSILLRQAGNGTLPSLAELTELKWLLERSVNHPRIKRSAFTHDLMQADLKALVRIQNEVVDVRNV